MAFAARRAREHLARLSLLALVVIVAVAGISGIDAADQRALADGAARMLADAEPSSRTMRVVALEAADGPDQDAAVRDAVDAAFDSADIAVSRQASLDIAAESPAGAPFSLRLLDDHRVTALTEPTGGRWPQSPGEIALPDAALQHQGLSVGDVIALPGADSELTVVGAWTAHDPTDPAWHGDPGVASGRSGDAIGPALVAPGDLANLPGTQTITWEIAPARTDVDRLPAMLSGVDDLRSLPDVVDPQRQRSTRVLGDLGATLQREAEAVAATRGLLVAPLLIIALLCALVLGVVITTLSAARGEETALLRARGASRRRLALGAAAEAALFAAAGAVVALLPLSIASGVTAAALLTAGGAIVFAGTAAAIVTARLSGRADLVRPDARRSDAGVRALPALLLPAGIAAAVAGLSAWQLFTTGSVVRSDGSPEPLAAAAPALLLIAACALVPVIAAPLAALLERLLRRSRGIAPILPLRQTARRMGTAAVAILCLALAAASLSLAVSAPATASAAEQRNRTALLGWDVRVTSDAPLEADAADAATWRGVADAADVLRAPLTVGSDTAVLVAAPPRVLGLGDGLPTAADDTLSAAATRSLADRIDATTGTVFTVRMRSVARPVSIQITRIVDDLPGVGAGWGVAVDPAELMRAGLEVPSNELWLRTDDADATIATLRAGATHPIRILTAAQVSAAPVTSIVPGLLAAGALVSAVLGVIGFLAASSATARARRGEAFVLRALGLPPGRGRALRVGETVGIAAYAVITGALLGALVAAAVLPIVLGVGA